MIAFIVAPFIGPPLLAISANSPLQTDVNVFAAIGTNNYSEAVFRCALLILLAACTTTFPNPGRDSAITDTASSVDAPIDGTVDASTDAGMADGSMDTRPTAFCTLTGPTHLAYRSDARIAWQAPPDAVLTLVGLTEIRLATATGELEVGPLSDDVRFVLEGEVHGERIRCEHTIRVARPDSLTVVGAGQSNIDVYFIWDTGAGARYGFGKTYFEERLGELDGVTGPVEFVDGAYGGSAILRSNVNPRTPDNYWLETQDGALSPGPRLRDALAVIEGRERVDFLIWAQGEADAISLGARLDQSGLDEAGQTVMLAAELEKYEAGLRYVFNSLRQAGGSPNIPIAIQMLGRRVAPEGRQHHAVHHIRRIQRHLSTVLPSVRIAANMYDANLYDSVHMNRDGRALVLRRLVQSISAWRSRELTPSGPLVLSARIEGSAVRVETHASSLQVGDHAATLFRFLDSNGSTIAQPTEVMSVRGGQLRLSFESGSTPAAGARLVIAFGSLSPLPADENAGYNFRLAGRFIHGPGPGAWSIEPGEVLLRDVE